MWTLKLYILEVERQDSGNSREVASPTTKPD